MARIKGVRRSRTLLARLAYFLSRRSYGRIITPARVYALDSGLLLAVGLMEEVQERAKQTSAPLKQLARMLVAWRIGCAFCLDFGTRQASQLGVTDEQLVALPDYEHSPLFSEEERAVLRYADAMTRTPVRVPEALFEARKRALYRPTNPGDHGGHCLGEFPRAGESCPRSGSRGGGRPRLSGTGRGATDERALLTREEHEQEKKALGSSRSASATRGARADP